MLKIGRKIINSISSVEQKALNRLHYKIPATFNKPKYRVYIFYYLENLTLAMYAFLTICDVISYNMGSFRTMALWILSSLSIVFTYIYGFHKSEQELKREYPEQANRKNYMNTNRYKRKYGHIPKIKESLYKRPVRIESVSMFIGAVLYTIVKVFFLNIYLAVIFKVIMSLLAGINFVLLILQSAMEFYEVIDYE